MANNVWGGDTDILLWGEDPLAWGEEADVLQQYVGVITHATMHIKELGSSPAEVRIWTGPGELTHGGHEWLSFPPWLLGFDPVTQTKELDDRNRTSVSLALMGEFEQEGLRMGVKRLAKTEVALRAVRSNDGGLTWSWIPGTLLEGVVSAPRLTRPAGSNIRAFTFEIATSDADIDRGYTQFWDNSSQQRLYLGKNDRFFEHVQKLEAGAVAIGALATGDRNAEI